MHAHAHAPSRLPEPDRVTVRSPWSLRRHLFPISCLHLNTVSFRTIWFCLTFAVPIKKNKESFPEQMWSFFEQLIVFHLVFITKCLYNKRKIHKITISINDEVKTTNSVQISPFKIISTRQHGGSKLCVNVSSAGWHDIMYIELENDLPHQWITEQQSSTLASVKLFLRLPASHTWSSG